MRDMVFLSHANPEDNEFTLWLALQLASQGYPVWCDLTKLLGGEDFWKDIEQAIRERTIKFLYVLSKTSNGKLGPLQELQVAQNVARDHGLQDFIIPLHIDNLPHREVNIRLGTINAISFNDGWASGLKMLLKKLGEDEIPQNPRFTPNAVTSWWRTHHSADDGIIHQYEEHLSNWFPIQSLPDEIYFHALTRSQIGKVEVEAAKLPYPAFQHDRFLVSFAKAQDFEGKLGKHILIEGSQPYSIEDFIDGTAGHFYVKDRREAQNFVSRLLNESWLLMLKIRQLPVYELANEAHSFYFNQGLAGNDKISFTGVDGEKTHRSIIGYATITRVDGSTSKRIWHFGAEAKSLLYPARAYCVKPHVLFSDDGKNIWDGKKRLHKARRKQCKNWWNPHWRDRILATMSWLADGTDFIQLPLGSDVLLRVSIWPLTFVSPVSFLDPNKHTSEVSETDSYEIQSDTDSEDEEEDDEYIEEGEIE